MKISELIKKLQEVQAEKGDLDVWVNSLDIEKLTMMMKFFILLVGNGIQEKYK